MAHWYVKELAKLTGVSVQTLHHYDRIGLLSPSLRQANGYRVYSETDLLRLQRVVAMKYLGFSLNQIKPLLKEDATPREHLQTQRLLLEEKAKLVTLAAKAIGGVLTQYDLEKSISWTTIMDTIEVYKMTEKLENAWVEKIFSPEELRDYASFEKEVKENKTPQEKDKFGAEWARLIAALKVNVAASMDPTSDAAKELSAGFMQYTNDLFGKENAHLRTKMLERGWSEGVGLEQAGMSPKEFSWFEKALDHYWRARIFAILRKVEATENPKLNQEWSTLMDEMYGQEEDRKRELIEVALKESQVSDVAKTWLRRLLNKS